MIYPYISVEYIDEPEQVNRELIEMYWTLEKGNFFYKSINLEFRFGLTQPKINRVVTEYSKATLYLDYCSKCDSDITFSIRNKSECNNLLKDESLRFLCKSCKTSFESSYTEKGLSEKCQFKLEFYYPLKLWKKLNSNEMEFLKYFLKINNYKKLIKGLTKDEFTEKWKMLEKFDNLGIIHISRNLDNKTNDISFLPALRQEIIGNVITKEHDIVINVPMKRNRTYGLQPHYAKKIIFNNPVSLSANTEYVCSIWHKPDGSLDIKLVPLSDLQKKNKPSNQEFTQVGEIVSKILKNID